VDFILYIFSGACVGLAIGVTGVGGGSLMTPLLLLFGFPLHIAVGTDLMYATLTKTGGAIIHNQKRNVEWQLVVLLAMGSLPAAVFTILLLDQFFDEPSQYGSLLSTALGFMLMLTSVVLLFRKRIQGIGFPKSTTLQWIPKHTTSMTIVMGIFLGVLVTLSSVGAAAIATAALAIFYPHLSALKVVATNICHAVPLTLVAGLGHIYLGNVDYLLLLALMIGSLPAIVFGTRVAGLIPDRILQSILASTLLVVGIKFAFF
jgi:uncharacterized membrane protein YfcA